MTKSYLPLINLLLIAGLMLSGCATKPSTSSPDGTPIFTSEQRAAQLLKNKKWQLRGRIAFIEKIKNEKDKRISASIAWQVNETKQTQTLNLTTYLGINVLHLESRQNQHLIKVDGEEYHATNLSQLLHSLTGLTLPTKALMFWLKGLSYNINDDLKIDPVTQLPISISSYYNNALWEINYSNYQNFGGINMATKFIIKKDGLLIKVAVKKWSFDE